MIPSPALPKFDFLASARLGPPATTQLLNDIAAGAFQVVDLVTDDYKRARELIERYADNDIGFVDAAVLAIVERLREPKLATLDHRHFGAMRPRHVTLLQLLPD